MSVELGLSGSRVDIYNSPVPELVAPSFDAVLTGLLRRCDPTSWAVDALARVAASPTFEAVAAPYAAASRKLRNTCLNASVDERAAVARLGADALVSHGPVAVFRALLLYTACGPLAESQRGELVDRVFATGDNEERVALLCTLPFLADPPTYVSTAVEACRANVHDVFAAIACENDYPSRWFGEPAFNQMVMKALFCGIALDRIRGLETRINAELRRMAADYAAERRAAGRSVPNDIALHLDGGPP